MARPVLYVLAGVNGAGKSSIGGYLLERQGVTWFNPDTFARELRAATGCDLATAHAHAWTESVRRLDEAISRRRHHAFETTLGGRTIAEKILEATETHEVLMWFIGLASPDLHVARVRSRVAMGGHDIPEARIRARYPRALVNLIALLPRLSRVQVYDNSATAGHRRPVPDPRLLLEVAHGRLVWPAAQDLGTLHKTPDWAKPIVEAALSLRPRPQRP